MLFLGVLSVFQLVLLPGLLLIRLFPARRSFLQNIAYVFMLSLLGNYVVIFLLVTVGLYTRTVVMLLFAAELAALFWFNRSRITARIGNPIDRLRAYVSDSVASFSEWLKDDFWSAAFYFVFSVVAAICLLWLVAVWIDEFDGVFQAWDAYASWDLWAEKWAANRFPGGTWEYPQLIPVSYSLTYKFIGTIAVKFFGKSIMPLFTMVIVLMLVDLARERKSFGFMLGAGLAFYGILFLLPEYIAEGYVDIPVAGFSLMGIYTLFKAERAADADELKQTLLLGSLATAAAAVTKQTGGYVMAFYPVFAYLWLLRDEKFMPRRAAIAMLAKHFLLVLVIVVPWYAVMQYRILTGGNTSNIQYVINDIYEGQTLPERFVVAVDSLGSYIYFYLFLIVSLLVLDNRFRQIVVLVILPFSILWALFLSYEYRNLAVALPLVGMTAGVAAENWVARIRRLGRAEGRRQVPAYALLGVLLLALALGTVLIDSETIIQKQISEQKLIFEPLVNQKLYRYFSSNDGPQPVISSYPVGWLPGLEQYWHLNRFDDYDNYQRMLQNLPHVRLILLDTLRSDERILIEVQQGIENGTYQLIFTEEEYILVQIPARE